MKARPSDDRFYEYAPLDNGFQITPRRIREIMGCGRKIGPYDCCTVVCGDCLELMKALPDGCIDAVITDPPYGIGASKMNFGMWRTSKMKKSDWDDIRADISGLHRLAAQIVVWGGNYFDLPPTRCFLVWNKGAGFKGRDFAECELAWTNMDANSREITYDPLAAGDYRDKRHPTQKPLSVMEWCIQNVGMPETILDPFLGSGTTAVAAIKLKRHFLGFEISKDYCEIARERIRIAQMQMSLFDSTSSSEGKVSGVQLPLAENTKDSCVASLLVDRGGQSIEKRSQDQHEETL